VLLLGKGDLHGIVLGDLKALQGIASCPCLYLIVKLHKGNIMPPRDQTDLLEAREPVRRERQNSGTQLSTSQNIPPLQRLQMTLNMLQDRPS
jgi:hypothetical protein